MDKEILDRLEKIEKQLPIKKKDFWEKLQVITPLLIPLLIALLGWYFTYQHNKTQLDLQQINNENQLQVALINSSVGQSGLIKDFMQQLTSSDTAAKNIAIEAILYAAPTPGKRIVDIIAKSSNVKTREIANDALSSKRTDLISNLYSTQKQNRVIAANEIISNWSTDDKILSELIMKADNCLSNKDSSPDCDNGIYNTMVVFASFSKQLLISHEQSIKSLIKKIPVTSKLTLTQSKEILNKME